MKRLNESAAEIVIAVLLLVSIFCLSDPFRTMMGEMLEMYVTVLLVIFTVLFIGMVWQEKARDEREQTHRLLISRAGFIAGMASVTIAIIVQMLAHELDGWLIIILGSMVLTKLVALIVVKRRF